MKRFAIVVLFSAVLSAQTTIWQVPIWTVPPAGRGYYQWLTLGPTLAITNGKIDAVFPPTMIPKRIYGTVLTASGGNYPVPTGATNVTVFLNGIRVTEGTDYNILTGVIAPLASWPGSNIVLIDYDRP